MIAKSPFIWMDGQLRPWQDANVHVMTHALHYGSSVFEGIRLYPANGNPLFFRLEDHIHRLFQSAKIYRLPLAWEEQQVCEACHELVRACELSSAYLRPLLFLGEGHMGLHPSPDCRSHLVIAAFEWPTLLGQEALSRGVSVGVSSWRRPAPDTHPALAKAGGNYLSSQLIAEEAQRHGYDEGLALDVQGFVSEGPGENIFAVRGGRVFTPSIGNSILAGITRDSVLKMLAEKGVPVLETSFPREWLTLCDELFFTGTAAEIVPIRSIDGLAIGLGERGPLTRELQEEFFGLFRGNTQDRWGWTQPLRHALAWF